VGFAAFPLYSVRSSWLALGAAGRELAQRGAVSLGEELGDEVRVSAFVSRGLCRNLDLFLCVEADDLLPLERYLQRLAVTTAGRHLETLDTWLGCKGVRADDRGDIFALYAVSGAVTPVCAARAARAGEWTGVSFRSWRSAGIGPADHLVLAGAADALGLSRLYDHLLRDAVLEGLSVQFLGIGRRRPLAEALECFSAPLEP
jgi:hypothetical protein